jgi:hypothetical protein
VEKITTHMHLTWEKRAVVGWNWWKEWMDPCTECGTLPRRLSESSSANPAMLLAEVMTAGASGPAGCCITEACKRSTTIYYTFVVNWQLYLSLYLFHSQFTNQIKEMTGRWESLYLIVGSCNMTAGSISKSIDF